LNEAPTPFFIILAFSSSFAQDVEQKTYQQVISFEVVLVAILIVLL